MHSTSSRENLAVRGHFLVADAEFLAGVLVELVAVVAAGN